MARRFRRMRRNDAEYVWCGLQLAANTILTDTAEEQLIVEGPDWFGGAGQAECVLQRIRGFVNFAVTVGAEATNGVVQIAVYKAEEDAGAYAVPWTVDELIDEDILLFEQYAVVRSATGIALPQPLNVELDIKVKRRLKANEGIRIMVSADNVAGTWGVATRALVRL